MMDQEKRDYVVIQALAAAADLLDDRAAIQIFHYIEASHPLTSRGEQLPGTYEHLVDMTEFSFSEWRGFFAEGIKEWIDNQPTFDTHLRYEIKVVWEDPHERAGCDHYVHTVLRGTIQDGVI